MEVQRKLASLDVILWLRENYKVGKNGSVSKNSVFQHYYYACQDKGIEPVISATYFGKLVKRAFPGIKYNRKGPRGSAVQHYTCLKRMKQPGEHHGAPPGTRVATTHTMATPEHFSFCKAVPSPYTPHDYGAAGAASTLLGGQYAAEDLAMCNYSLKREKVDYDEASPSLAHSPTTSFSPRRRRSMFSHVSGASAHAPTPHHPYHHPGASYPYPVPHYHHHRHHPELLHPPYCPPPAPPSHARVPTWSPATADDGPPPVSDAGAPCSSPDEPPSNPWREGATTGSHVPSYHPHYYPHQLHHQGQYHHRHHYPPHNSAPYDLEDTSPYSHTTQHHPRPDPYHHPSSSSSSSSSSSYSFAPHHRSPSPTIASYSPRHRAFSHSGQHPRPAQSHPANSPSPMPPPFSPVYSHPSMAPGSHSQAHPHPYSRAHAHAGPSRPSGSSSPTSPSGSSHIGSSNPPSPPSPPPHLLLPSLDSAAFASPLLPSPSGHTNSSATNRAADTNHQHLHHHGYTGEQHARPQQPASGTATSYSPGASQPAGGAVLSPASSATTDFETPTHLEVYSSPAFAGAEQPLRPPLGRSSSPAFEHLLRGITSRDVEDEELVSFCDRYLKQAHTP